jgi:tetratricopeptide (TPR) repeat protein
VYQKHYLSKNLLTTLDWKDALEAQHEYLKRTTGIFQWIENTPAELKHFAMHQYHQGEFQHSIKHFRKALQLTPWDPDLLISLGKVHYDLGNYTQARNYLERTLSIKPGDEDARMGISLIENKLDTVSKQGIPH